MPSATRASSNEPVRHSAAEPEARPSGATPIVDRNPMTAGRRAITHFVGDSPRVLAQRRQFEALSGRDPASDRAAEAAGPAPLTSGAPAQLKKGDGVIVANDTPLHAKRSSTSKEVATAKAGQVGIELTNPTQKWTQIQLNEKVEDESVSGWILVEHIRYDEAFSQSDDSRREEFSGSPDRAETLDHPVYGEEDEEVSSSDVEQGALGDCWVLGVLGAMAEADHGKAVLKRMVTDHKDGTYTVRLFTPSGPHKGDPVDVNVTGEFGVEGKQALYAKVKDREVLWPLVVEKAVAKFKGGIFELKGGFADEAMYMFTGKTPSGYAAVTDAGPDEPAAQESLQGVHDRLKDQKGKVGIVLSIPAENHNGVVNFTPTPKPGAYTTVLPHTGIKTDTITLTYADAVNAQVVKRGEKEGSVVILEQEDQSNTLVMLVPDANNMPTVDPLPVTTFYQVTDLANGISGGHLYYIYDFTPDDGNPGQAICELGDPNHADQTEDVTLTDAYTTYHAKFFFQGR